MLNQNQSHKLFTLRTYLLIVILLANFKIVKSQISNCPENMDFELGNLNNWKFGTGMCCPISASPINSAIAGRHELLSGSGLDQYGSFPIVPSGNGNFVLRLGNNKNGSESETASYSFVVPNSLDEFSLLYKYAIVLEDPEHSPSEQPRFEVKIYKAGNGSPIDCASYTFISNANLPGFKKSKVDTSILYRDWSVGSMDLTPYKGDTMILEFSTGDCSLGGHFGYAYVDVSCSNFNINAVFCKTDSLLKLEAPPGFQNYYWYNNDFSTLIDSGSKISILQPDLSSNYNLVVNPYTGYGCVDTFQTKIIISDLTLQISDSITVCNKEKFILVPKIKGNSNFYSFMWTPVEGLSCASCSNPEFTSIGTMTYNLEVTDQYGCKAVDSIKLTPSASACCNHVFIPNAFSPDNNGLNDLFITKTEIELSNFKFSIFNRWGEKLWQTNNYFSGWNGLYKGEPQLIGTYFYTLEYECLFNKKKYNKSGDFILLR